jgi:hypothetical protein
VIRLRTFLSLFLLVPAFINAQGGRGGRGGPPPPAQVAAPIDLTGYWTAVITEDWRVRMLTASKGDFGSGPNAEELPFGGQGNIPYNAEGKRLSRNWDPAKDEASGNACAAYGAGGIMRLATHLHISWQDQNTMRMDLDAGNQTRVFYFSATPPARGPDATAPGGASSEPTMQGNSIARWKPLGGTSDWSRGGNLEVVTTNLKPGYYWKNGMVYSGKTTLTEHYRVTTEPSGETWLHYLVIAEDPQYLTQPWIVNYHFKKLPDGSKWNPTPCAVR